MGYRHTQQRELCISCGELADGNCLRCDSPHCDDHRPQHDQRCQHCQALYGTLRNELRRDPLSPGMLAACYLLSSAAAAAATALMMHLLAEVAVIWLLLLLLPIIAVLALAPLWLALLRKRRLQRSFRAERPHQLLLPKPQAAPHSAPAVVVAEMALANISLAFLVLCIFPVLGQVWGVGYASASLLLSRARKVRSPLRAKAALALHLAAGAGWLWLYLLV